jgi:hypothetical protein
MPARRLVGGSMVRVRGVGWVVAWLVLAAAPVASAQRGQDGALLGAVADPSGAVLPGVALALTSPELAIEPLHVVSDDSGRYRFPALLPGRYHLDATHAGFQAFSQPDIVIPPGLTITIDVVLGLDTLTERVEVRSLPAAIDIGSSSSPTAIDRLLLDSLPLSRDVHTYLALAPGVNGSVAFGGTARANPLRIDGAAADDPRSGQPVVPYTRAWIDELQIVGPGAEAQYGGFTGAQLNVVTRSGTNRLSGLGEWWTTRPSWGANNRGGLAPAEAEQFSPLQIVERWELVGQAGAPLRRDRVWLFAGGQQFVDDTIAASFAALPAGAERLVTEQRDRRGIGRITAALPSRLLAHGNLARIDRRGRRQDAGPFVRPEATTSSDSIDDIAGARLLWTASSATTVEARVGGNRRRGSGGAPRDRRNGPPGRVDLLTEVYSGNAPFYSDTAARVVTAGVTATSHVDAWAGRHELKAGVEHEWARSTIASGQPGGLFYYDVGGEPHQLEIWPGATVRVRQRRTSMFVQDGWAPLATVTINAGLRVDASRAVPPYAVRVSMLAVAPRIGAAWDVGGRHHTVVRAHYGRYFDPFVGGYYSFLDPVADQPRITAEAQPDGTWRELFRSSPATNFGIDPDVRPSFVSEILAGVEHALPGRIAVKVQYLRRRFDDTVAFIDTTTVWRPVQVVEPGPDGVTGTADDTGIFTLYDATNASEAFRVLTNPPQAYRRYDAVQLVASRRAAQGLAFQASYTWSRTRGNFNNNAFVNAAGQDAGLGGVFANPNRAINRDGRTGNDLPHAVKALAAWQAPGGWTVSGVYRYECCLPWARNVRFRAGLTQGFEFVLVEPFHRQGPSTHVADVRLEKTVRVGRLVAGLYLDAFNVANLGRATGFSGFSGPFFGTPDGWTAPRVLRSGLRLSF